MLPSEFFSLPRSRREWAWIVAYLVGYLLLDWVSFIHPWHSFNVTPWNPPPGL